jgi:hypothetical protein
MIRAWFRGILEKSTLRLSLQLGQLLRGPVLPGLDFDDGARNHEGLGEIDLEHAVSLVDDRNFPEAFRGLPEFSESPHPGLSGP